MGEGTRCKDACSCTCGEGKKKPPCSVGQCPGDRLVFLKPLNKEACKYQAQFGKFCICTCPKRGELYSER